MPEKISHTQIAEMSKVAASTLRALSEDNTNLRAQNVDLKEKVAAFEKKARAEKIASQMEDKGINGDVPFAQKVAELVQRDNLDVVEEAVSMAAPQTKLATIHEDGVEVETTGDESVDRATQQFAANLASLG